MTVVIGAPSVETAAQTADAATDANSGGIVAPPPAPPPVAVPGSRVVLRGLDKLNGEVETVSGPVGGVVLYERLQIEVKACYSRTAANAPESSVFMKIIDTKYLDRPERMNAFTGWMFASSPALSAMDHPRYDVWVLACEVD